MSTKYRFAAANYYTNVYLENNRKIITDIFRIAYTITQIYPERMKPGPTGILNGNMK